MLRRAPIAAAVLLAAAAASSAYSLAVSAAAGVVTFDPIPWEAANEKASAMLSRMNREERLTRSWG